MAKQLCCMVSPVFIVILYSLSPQLPRTSCSFSELNYTFIIENKQENFKAEIDVSPNPDSGMISRYIELDLKENQKYYLKLQVKAQSQIATSQKHIFSKLVFIYSILTTETLY